MEFWMKFVADISLTPYLEGLVILKKNPDYEETAAINAKK
jgi:hypothetical protein